MDMPMLDMKQVRSRACVQRGMAHIPSAVRSMDSPEETGSVSKANGCSSGFKMGAVLPSSRWGSIQLKRMPPNSEPPMYPAERPAKMYEILLMFLWTFKARSSNVGPITAILIP